MKTTFEELDFQHTPLGKISLRRRSEPRLGDEFLMSGLFAEDEIQLAKLGLAALEGAELDIVVDGLGLGLYGNGNPGRPFSKIAHVH